MSVGAADLARHDLRGHRRVLLRTRNSASAGGTGFSHLLLGRGVVIVEGLDLSAVSAGVYQLVCLPLRLQGLDGAPARAVLMENP